MQRTTRRGWILLVCAALASCMAPVEEDGTLSGELRDRVLERVVIARMYQRNHWVIAAVDPARDRAAAAQYVCDAIASLRPTYVSGLIRLNYEDAITEEQEDMFRRVRNCIQERSPHETRVRFDVVLNALQYSDATPDEGGWLTVEQLRDRLRDRRRSIENRLQPDGYFFDFYSQPWGDPGTEGPYRPEVLESGIGRMRDENYFVGGNVWGAIVPPGSDFVAITDKRGREGVGEQIDRLRAQGVPVLLHVRNDPHIEGSGGRLWNERDRAYRKRQLRRHLRWSRDFGASYMFPVFFPLMPNPVAGGGPWVAYDASADGNMLERMGEYLGAGEAAQRLMSSSGEDAVPTVYDPEDDGLVLVHRSANYGAGQHLYSRSVLEIEDTSALTMEVEGYFALSRVEAPGTVPFYRCYVGGGDHVMTTDANCESVPGAANEGLLGFIGTAQLEGTVPVHRMSKPGSDGVSPDHFYTTSVIERAGAQAYGYVDEGIAGYVFDASGLAVLDIPSAPPPEPAPEPVPEPAPAPVHDRVAIVRGVHSQTGQHLFSTSLDEILYAPGVTFETQGAFYLERTTIEGTTPWYRCYLGNGWHLLTTSWTCEGAPGAINEGALGNIATTQLPETVPLYRLFRGGRKPDHFYTTSEAERDSAVFIGYAAEGVAGYVYPNP